MPRLLGIDVGTSTVKAVVTDPAGRALASGSADTPWRSAPPGFEATAYDLLGAALAAVREAAAGLAATHASPAGVAGVGVAGFAESAVIADGSGAPVAPVIAWHDPRGQDAEQDLRSGPLGGRFAALTGQPISTRLTAVKYRWLRTALGFDAGSTRLLTVPEWIIQQLGGEPRPELSLWSRTGFLDIEQPRILPEVASWAGLPWQHLPPPAPAGTPAGRVRDPHGIPMLRGAVLTVAGHDHVCAAAGAGAADDADACDSWGNGEALLRGVPALPQIPEVQAAGFSVSHHVLPGRRVLFRGLGTGLLLRRVLAILGASQGDHAGLDRAALAAADAPLPSVRLGVDGGVDVLDIPETAGPAAVWRAALLAAFARVRDGVAELEQVSGPVRDVIGCGGWLRSEPVRTLKTEQVPRFRPSGIAEPAARGAALLAGLAADCGPGYP